MEVPSPQASPATDLAERLSPALEAMIARFRGYIVAIGRRHGLSDADTDEVVQEIRLRVWRSRGDPETIGGVGPSYIYRAAVSAAVDVLRRRRARRTGLDAVEPLSATSAAVPPAAPNALEGREMEDRIYMAVGELLPSRRPVVKMHLAGYDRHEIAEALGCSVGKVRNLLSRGLADLRTLLERAGIGPEGSA